MVQTYLSGKSDISLSFLVTTSHLPTFTSTTRPGASVVSIVKCSRWHVLRSMASIPLLSLSERQYILDGVKQNIRADGRKCDAVGYFNQKTGVASNTNGSAKVDRVSGRGWPPFGPQLPWERSKLVEVGYMMWYRWHLCHRCLAGSCGRAIAWLVAVGEPLPGW